MTNSQDDIDAAYKLANQKDEHGNYRNVPHPDGGICIPDVVAKSLDDFVKSGRVEMIFSCPIGTPDPLFYPAQVGRLKDKNGREISANDEAKIARKLEQIIRERFKGMESTASDGADS